MTAKCRCTDAHTLDCYWFTPDREAYDELAAKYVALADSTQNLARRWDTNAPIYGGDYGVALASCAADLHRGTGAPAMKRLAIAVAALVTYALERALERADAKVCEWAQLTDREDT